MVKKSPEKKVLITGIIIILIGISIFLGINYFFEEESFSKTSLLKLNIPLGGESVNNIKIVNYKETEQSFSLYFNGLKDLASIKDREFTLGPKESMDAAIYFKDHKNEVGIYSGQLIIETPTIKEKIPVILGIEYPDSPFAIIQNSIPKYDNVYPGGKLGIEIKVFDIGGADSPSVKAEYFIQNFDNEIIESGWENLIVGGSVSKIIDIKKTLPYGDYVFVTSIDYKETKSIAGYLFSISEKKEEIVSGNFKFFIIIILVFVGGILALFFYFVKTRDDLLIQLKKQQDKELKRSLDFVKSYKSELKKIRKVPEKKKKINELGKIKKKIVEKIKVKQKIQRKELKKLKKKGKKTEKKNKIASWKRQCFKMFET